MRDRRQLLAVIPVMLIAGILIFFTTADVSAKKHSQRGWLGVYIQDIDSDIADAMDLKSKDGVLVDDVVDDSPAEKAGIEPGDVIVKFNGKDAKSERKLRYLIKRTKPGDKVNIIVIRDGKEQKLNVEMGKSKSRSLSWSTDDDFIWSGKGPLSIISKFGGPGLGIIIEDLNEQMGEYFGVKDGDGVLVKEVMDDSPAEKAGFKAGDVIVQADGDEIEDIGDLQEALSEKEDGDKMTLKVLRHKKEKKLTAEVSDKFGSGGHFKSFTLGHDFPKKYKIRIPSAPDVDLRIHEYRDDLKKSMKELKKELKELKRELKKEFKNLDID